MAAATRRLAKTTRERADLGSGSAQEGEIGLTTNNHATSAGAMRRMLWIVTAAGKEENSRCPCREDAVLNW